MIEITFQYEKDTPNKVRLKEITEGDAAPKVGSLYIDQGAYAELGKPEQLKVCIEAAE